MCSKTPPLFGVFSATQASPSQGKGFPAFLRAGVYSQIQVLTVRYAAWRLRLGRQQIEEAGAGNCFLLRESMGPWAAGGSRVWAFQGQGCELCAVMPPIGVSSEAIHSVVLVRPRSCGPQALPSHPPGLFWATQYPLIPLAAEGGSVLCTWKSDWKIYSQHFPLMWLQTGLIYSLI